LAATSKPQTPESWIGPVRNRRALRRAEKPATKAGQIRALWPEISAALAGGQSVKSIRDWLEEDAGILVATTSLTSYISRVRREKASCPLQASSVQSVRPQSSAAPVLTPFSPAPLAARNRHASPVSARAEDLLAQATITIPAGYKFTVRVNRDILFDEPYQPVPPLGSVGLIGGSQR
jgi:hypothetical protein